MCALIEITERKQVQFVLNIISHTINRFLGNRGHYISHGISEKGTYDIKSHEQQQNSPHIFQIKSRSLLFQLLYIGYGQVFLNSSLQLHHIVISGQNSFTQFGGSHTHNLGPDYRKEGTAYSEKEYQYKTIPLHSQVLSQPFQGPFKIAGFFRRPPHRWPAMSHRSSSVLGPVLILFFDRHNYAISS
jgi:hypothetical protein